MRRLDIEFARRPRWALVWVPALIAALFVVALTGRSAGRRAAATHVVQEQMERVEAETRTLQKATADREADRLRSTDAVQARYLAAALGVDWADAFLSIERTDVPQTRLMSVQLDGSSGTVRLNYELDSVDRATAVTSALNVGYDKGPWRLEAANRSGPGTQNAEKFMASWSARLADL